MGYDEYKVDVPEGVSGGWSVQKFTVSKEQAEFERIRSLSSGGRGVPEGSYTGLYRGRSVIMSDTPDEIRDHLPFIRRATGRVLIAGLGLGMVAQAVARKPDVVHVTVIEQSPDVVFLLKRHLLSKPFGSKITIDTVSIFDYKPLKDERYDFAWYDIWDDLCTDNLDEMAKLHRKFGRRVGVQDSWGKGLLKRKREQEKRNPWRW